MTRIEPVDFDLKGASNKLLNLAEEVMSLQIRLFKDGGTKEELTKKRTELKLKLKEWINK